MASSTLATERLTMPRIGTFAIIPYMGAEPERPSDGSRRTSSAAAATSARYSSTIAR